MLKVALSTINPIKYTTKLSSSRETTFSLQKGRPYDKGDYCAMYKD
jgi:hypothetical protein